MKALRILLVGVCAIHLAAAPGGRLDGVVRDATGVPVRGARVEISNDERHSLREAGTSQAGEFQMLSLEPGAYTVRVEAEGFRAAVLAGTLIQLDQTTSVSVRLEVGPRTDSIVVPAEVPRVD